MIDVIIPKSFLGITPGPVLEGLQMLVTVSVELADGSVLRLAIPQIALEMWESPRDELTHA